MTSLLEGVEIDASLIEGITKRNNLTRDGAAPYLRKNWTPAHTEIVLLEVRGRSLKEIGEITGFSPLTIAQILKTPQAKEIKLEIAKKAFEARIAGTSERVLELKMKALDNMTEFVFDQKGLKEKNPFGFFDRMVTVAKLAAELDGSIKPSVTQQTTNTINNTQVNAVFGTPKAQEELSDGLNKAMEVAQVYTDMKVESYGNTKSLKND